MNAQIEILPPDPWQDEDISYLDQREDNSANWSEMGCKKTSTGLWIAEKKATQFANGSPPAILVVTSRTGKGSYFQLAPGILPGWTIFNVRTDGIWVLVDGTEVKLSGYPFLPKKIAVPHLVITHYNLFSFCQAGKPKLDERKNPIIKEDGTLEMMPWKQGDYIIDHDWDVVILDEAHRIKDRQAKQTRGVKKLKAKYRHVMTGTGFINRPDEIWSLLNFLDKSEFRSYWDFREEYCMEDEYNGYRSVVGIKPDKVDNFRKLVRTVGVRRTLDEVLPSIKQPRPIRVDVDLSPTQRKMYNGIVKELAAFDKNGVPFNSPNVLSALQRCRQICVATPEVVADYFDEKEQRRVVKIKLTEPSSKLDAVMEILDGLEWDEDSKQPLVIFSCFRDPLDLLEKRFEKAGISFIHLKAEDSDELRYQKWAIQFPTKQYRVFMSTLQLGGESINLTPARHVCFLDRSWSPKDNAQGIGRVRRPGQTGEPIVINIEAENTTDQRIERVVNIKAGWFKEIFGAEEKQIDLATLEAM